MTPGATSLCPARFRAICFLRTLTPTARALGVFFPQQATRTRARASLVFGALYGSLALWRGSLRPGMTAHAGSDILSGIFGP